MPPRRRSPHRARCASTLVSDIQRQNSSRTVHVTHGCKRHSPSLLSTLHLFPSSLYIFSFVGTNYQVLDVVGEGAYGIVCSAVHKPSGRKVAIKKIAPFDHSMFCLRTLRELKLLKFLSEAGVSENIISILDIIKPRSIDDFKEVYCA